MDNIIQNDFADFVKGETLFNCEVKLYTNQGGSLVFEGRGLYDKKPQAIENENGQIGYQGHKSLITLSLKDLLFMNNAFFSLKGYYIEITDNLGMKAYTIVNSSFNSNVNTIFNELKTI